MKVKLTYFKESGKCYTSGEYDSQHEHAFEVYKEVHHLQQTDTCPGINGNARQFIILVQPTDCAPYLVVP